MMQRSSAYNIDSESDEDEEIEQALPKDAYPHVQDIEKVMIFCFVFTDIFLTVVSGS